jgi:hypothetical protein
MTRPQYRITAYDAHTTGGIDRFVIAVGESAVAIRPSNGSERFLTYKTRQRAEAALAKAKAGGGWRGLRIHDKQGMRWISVAPGCDLVHSYETLAPVTHDGGCVYDMDAAVDLDTKKDRQDASAETQSTPTPDGPSGTEGDYSTDLVAVHAVQDALSVLDDASVALAHRANVYYRVRQLRLALDRVLKKVGPTIRTAIVDLQREADPVGYEAGRRFRAGPLRLVWKSIEPRYVCNEPSSHTDPTIQQALFKLRSDPRYAMFVRQVPQHYEVDTSVLGAEIAAGSQNARDLYDQLRDRKWRVEEGRSPTIELT